MGGGRPIAVEEAVNVGAPDAEVATSPAAVTEAERLNRETRIRRALALILTGAFALRLIVFLVALQDPRRFYTPDGHEYWTLAQHFTAGFGNTPSVLFDLGLKRTPGYPAMIVALTSLTGDRESVVTFVQVLMGVATVALLYLLVRELCGVRAALIAAALLAVDPISVIMPSYIQPETFFTLLLVSGTLVLLRAIRARSWILMAVAGVTFGAAVLVRPVALYIWILLIPLVWLLSSPERWRKRLINSGIVVLAFLVPVGGWIVRNERTTGVATLSTIQGRDLLLFRAANALAFDTGISLPKARLELNEKVASETGGKNAAERGQTQTSEAIRTMRAHPMGTAYTSASGFVHLLTGPGRAELFKVLGLKHPNRLGGMRTLTVAIEALLLLILLAGAAAGGLLAIGRREWRVLAIGGGFAAYLAVIASSGAAYSRYRAPAAPYFALLAGFAGAWLITYVRSSRNSASGVALSERDGGDHEGNDEPHQ